VKDDPMAIEMGVDEDFLSSLSDSEILSFPEATIVSIVEMWSILHKQGIKDSDIFSRIENHRTQVFPRCQMPTTLNLTNYIKCRLDIEHSHGGAITDIFVESAVEIAKKAYTA
jgi:hypothetical protein